MTYIETIRRFDYVNGRWGVNTASVEKHCENGDFYYTFHNGFSDAPRYDVLAEVVSVFDKFVEGKECPKYPRMTL